MIFIFFFLALERNGRKINRINNFELRNSMCAGGDGGDENQQFPGQWQTNCSILIFDHFINLLNRKDFKWNFFFESLEYFPAAHSVLSTIRSNQYFVEKESVKKTKHNFSSYCFTNQKWINKNVIINNLLHCLPMPSAHIEWLTHWGILTES